MSRSAPAYDIGRPLGRCALTDAVIAPGERFIAALIDPPASETPDDAPDGVLQRLDIAIDTWQQGQRPDHLFAFWHATMKPPKEDDSLVDTDNLLELFDALEDADEPRRVAFRYTLALMLIRSRLLTQRGQRAATTDAPAALLVTRKGEPADAPTIEVTEPDLDPETLADMTRQLRDVLKVSR